METILYRAPLYKQDGRLYRGKAPSTPFLNSSYESSAIAHIMRLRYGYAMPVESICRMLREDGFNMSKKTADGLLRKTSGILENLYLALRDTVLKADYLNIDETYYRILSEKKPETAENGSASGTGCSTGKDTVDNNGPSLAGMPTARGSRKRLHVARCKQTVETLLLYIRLRIKVAEGHTRRAYRIPRLRAV